MARRIFVNLPVADLKRSMLFFAQLGFSYQPQWTDDNAACMIIGDDSFVMLLSTPFFQAFTPRPIADAHQCTEVITCISAETREAVDRLVDIALSIGAIAVGEPQDHGFMYSRSFQDPDGHIWEMAWIDMDAAVADA